jgi:hypothetical protein
MKKNILIILSLLIYTAAYTQKVIDVTPIQDNNQMVVKYKIVESSSNQKFNVSLYVSIDGGVSYKGPLKSVTGDVGEGIIAGENTIIWDIFKDVDDLKGSVVFDIRAIPVETFAKGIETDIKSEKRQKVKKKFFISYMGSTNAPIGLSIGQLGKTGWYGSFKMSAFQKQPEYVYEGDSWPPSVGSSEHYDFNNTREVRKLSVTLGLTQQLGTNAFWYIGGGYGVKQQIWQIDTYVYNDIIESAYVENPEKSYSGFELESGFTIRMSKILLSAGFTNINFKSTKLTFGLGLNF